MSESKNSLYKNSKVQARYETLKGMSKSSLVALRQKHHRVSDESEVKRMMKDWIITDILEAEFGRKKLDETIEIPIKEEAPANATTAVPGAGSDNSLHMKKMRMWKAIHRRHRIPGLNQNK